MDNYKDRIKELYGEDYWIANNQTDNEDLNNASLKFANLNYSLEGTESNEYILAISKYSFIAGANFIIDKI